MSFTEDELQAFNSILEQRFSAHRQEMEQVFEQRVTTLRQDIQQQIALAQTEIVDSLKRWWVEVGKVEISTQLDTRQQQVVQAISHETEQNERQVEETIDQMLAAQLLGIEQLLNTRASLQPVEYHELSLGEAAQLETVEVQTDLAWEDLALVVSRGLDERFAALSDAFQHSLTNLEHYLSGRLHTLHEELLRYSVHGQSYSGTPLSTSSVQDVLLGIEQLGRIVESMQVAMTANHALLSNRLYHHQQLPLERAHPSGSRSSLPSSGSAALDRIIGHKEKESDMAREEQ